LRLVRIFLFRALPFHALVCGQRGSKSKTHSVLTCVGVRIAAEWRGAAHTSGLGVVQTYTNLKLEHDVVN
jgi:uncharacterized membrane protein